MKGPEHLGELPLVALASAGRPPSSQESRHLSLCPECRARLEATRAVLGALRRSACEPAPEGALERGLGELRRAAPREAMPVACAAQFSPGSLLEAPAGLRSAAPATRQWLFRAGPLEVDLQAFPEGPEARRVLGQALDREGAVAGLAVHLRHDGEPVLVSTDRNGEFVLSGVRGRSVQLLVETEEEVYRLDLGPVPEADAGGE